MVSLKLSQFLLKLRMEVEYGRFGTEQVMTSALVIVEMCFLLEVEVLARFDLVLGFLKVESTSSSSSEASPSLSSSSETCWRPACLRFNPRPANWCETCFQIMSS